MLNRKMLRDMRLHRMQFVSICLMAFLGVFVYTGISGEWRGMQRTVDEYYEETRMADVILYGENFNQSDLKAVQSVPGITSVQKRLTMETVGSFPDKPAITLHIMEQNLLSTPYLQKGEPFNTGTDGVWLDERFASAKGLTPGDTLTLRFGGKEWTQKIQGTVYGPDHVYFVRDGDLGPDFSKIGYAYVSASALNELPQLPYNQLLLATSRTDWGQLESEISAKLGSGYSVFLPRRDLESVSMFQNEISQHKALGSIFPVAFLAVAILTILTTMTRLVNSQRLQIGTLKAMGFSRSKIMLHYISYGFWVSLVGALLGALVGPMTLPQLFYFSLAKYYTLPEWESAVSADFFAMAVLAVLVCTAATYLACRSILQDSPSETLRPKAPRVSKRTLLEKLLLPKRASFNTRWNLRDVLRNKIRSTMAVIGVLSCMTLLICALGMQDSMNDVSDWQYKEINRFESKLSIGKEAGEGDVAAALAAINGQALMEAPIELKVGGDKRIGSAIITDGVTLLSMTDSKRKPIELPQDGLSISYKMAHLLQVQEGDEISWHLYGDNDWITSRIAEIYRSPTQQGIMVSRAFFEQNGGDFKASSILTAQSVDNELTGISSSWSAADLSKGWDDSTESMSLLVYVMIFAAVLLAVVVLYNLGLLSFTEKEREFATLKVIGFQAGQIRKLLLTQNIWLSILGIILGIPLGRWLIDSMIATMGDSFDMMTIVKPYSIAVSIVLTLFLSIAVNWMFSGKIKRVDMVSSLKGTE